MNIAELLEAHDLAGQLRAIDRAIMSTPSDWPGTMPVTVRANFDNSYQFEIPAVELEAMLKQRQAKILGRLAELGVDATDRQVPF